METALHQQATLPVSQRLSTRLGLANGLVLACLLGLATTWLRDVEIRRASERLVEVGSSLLPFMVPSIRPALDIAVDQVTGEIDAALLSDNVIQSAFEVA